MPKCAFVRRNETTHQILVIYMTCTAFQILFKYSSLVRKLLWDHVNPMLIMHYNSPFYLKHKKIIATGTLFFFYFDHLF